MHYNDEDNKWFGKQVDDMDSEYEIDYEKLLK